VPGWILRYQEPAERFWAPVTVAVDLSSFSGTEEAPSGRYAVPAGMTPNAVPLRPRTETPLTYRSLKDHVDYMLRSYLNILDAS
jgi:hypothetical protein